MFVPNDIRPKAKYTHGRHLLPMPPPLRLEAVAFISPQNHPILVRTFAPDKSDELKYHYLAHTSLDVIEERGEHQYP
jgi:hypothetical protein